MSSESDFSARDSAIATNSYTTVVGRAKVSEDHFRAYWRDVHEPLCARVPGLGWYTQHHFARRQDSHLWLAPEGVGTLEGYELDGAVEIGWSDSSAQRTFQDAASILFSDEQNVFEETVAYSLPAGSVTAFDRQADGIPNGPDAYDRVHVHFTPAPGRAADLARYLAGEFADIARTSDEVVKLRIHAPEDHDNSTPNPPAPNVQHTVSAERVALVIIEMAFHSPLARRRFFASAAYQSTRETQRDLAAYITPFAVSGVFTFVRDEALTTAGLRGSRVAELIGDLAALNQVGADVATLMHTGRLAD